MEDRTKLIQEVGIGVLLLAAVFSFLDPFMLFMPSMPEMWALLVLIVLFAIFALMVWRERGSDEREDYHKLLAGRFAYLAGTAVLILALAVQSAAAHADPWIIYALGTMVLAKIGGFIWSRLKS